MKNHWAAVVSLDVQLGSGVGLSLRFYDVLCGFLCGFQELTKNDPAAEAACRQFGSWSGSECAIETV